MKYEVTLVRGNEKRTVIIDIGVDEVARAKQTPGDAEAVRRGAAMARAREFAPPGFEPEGARRFNWAGEMKFAVECVNPRTSEQITIRRELTSDQVAEACQSADPVHAVLMVSRPWPPGFMPIGCAANPLRPSLEICG